MAIVVWNKWSAPASVKVLRSRGGKELTEAVFPARPTKKENNEL